LLRSFYNLNFPCANRGDKSFRILCFIDTFTKYFGVCSGNSPVMPEKKSLVMQKLFHVKQLEGGNTARPASSLRPICCTPITLDIFSKTPIALSWQEERRNRSSRKSV
jgi:hypothetical protein